MEFLLFLGALVSLDLLALWFSHDSRDTQGKTWI